MKNPITIILLLILFFPLGLYFMWKNELWTLESRTIITLIFFFPLGIYFMFKKEVWNKKTRLIVVSGIVIILIFGTQLPPPFSPGNNYRVGNVYDCNECYSSWYMKVSDKTSGYIISVDTYNYKTQGCKVEFDYSKGKEYIDIELRNSRSVTTSCLSQFNGKYKIKDGKWTNGHVIIEESSSISLY